jgi:hypothetical protein
MISGRWSPNPFTAPLMACTRTTSTRPITRTSHHEHGDCRPSAPAGPLHRVDHRQQHGDAGYRDEDHEQDVRDGSLTAHARATAARKWRCVIRAPRPLRPEVLRTSMSASSARRTTDPGE